MGQRSFIVSVVAYVVTIAAVFFVFGFTVLSVVAASGLLALLGMVFRLRARKVREVNADHRQHYARPLI